MKEMSSSGNLQNTIETLYKLDDEIMVQFGFALGYEQTFHGNIKEEV